MTGRPRLDVGTYGDITITRIAAGRVQARTRFRDDDGRIRKVSVTARTRAEAVAALKRKLLDRHVAGGIGGSTLTGETPFPDLVAEWLTSIQSDAELSRSTKEAYERETRRLLLPTLGSFVVRELTVSRVERFIKAQRVRSYGYAKRSKTLLSLVMGYAVRHEAIPRNPVLATSPLRKPPRPPQALTFAEIERIRLAARTWHTEPHRYGPRPDGQIGDLIEVLIGTACRIGEALALRKCDVDMTANPPTVAISGTVVVHKGLGTYRQDDTKTAGSTRILAVPPFTAEVIRRRLVVLADCDDEQLLFSTRKNTPLYPHNVRRTFREIVELAGLQGRNITPHSFRRTGATLINRAAGEQLAASVLGHSDLSTTREHYIERDRLVDPKGAEILARLAPSPPPADEP